MWRYANRIVGRWLIKGWLAEGQPLIHSHGWDLEKEHQAVVGLDLDPVNECLEEGSLGLVVAVRNELNDLISDLGYPGIVDAGRRLLKIELDLCPAGAELFRLRLQFRQARLDVAAPEPDGSAQTVHTRQKGLSAGSA